MEKIPTTRPRPRCLIADDRVIFSEALMLYLSSAAEIVGVAYDRRALVAEAIRLRPQVVIVAMRDDQNLAAATLEHGAVAFVLKHSAGCELLQALDHVLP